MPKKKRYNKETQPSEFGRPTQYKPEYCDKLLQFGKEGGSFRAFCGSIGFHWDTGYEWVKKHKDFADAKKRASALSFYWWENVMKAGTIGKIKGFNLGAGCFMTKNMHGYQDNPTQGMDSDESNDLEFT